MCSLRLVVPSSRSLDYIYSMVHAILIRRLVFLWGLFVPVLRDLGWVVGGGRKERQWGDFSMCCT